MKKYKVVITYTHMISKFIIQDCVTFVVLAKNQKLAIALATKQMIERCLFYNITIKEFINISVEQIKE